MSPSPPPTDEGRVGPIASSVADWLRELSDEQLFAALRRRPDLALPAPVDLNSLASRAGVRTSIARALDNLDAFTLRVLEVIASLDEPGSEAEVTGYFDPADGAAVSAAVQQLLGWLLIWPSPSGLDTVGSVREVLGLYPLGLGRSAEALYAGVSEVVLAPLLRRLGLAPVTQPAAGLAAAARVLADLEALLAACDEAELAIVRRLSEGPPVGTLRAATSPLASAWQGSTPPARALLDRGLLVPIDRDTVELPREVALAVRRFPAGDIAPRPAEVGLLERGPSVLDGGGTTAVQETVRLVELMLHWIAAEAPTRLRAGGLGIRELRKLTKVLDVGEAVTALYLELAVEAGLLASSSGPEVYYLPTTDFDTWLRGSVASRWVTLATAWLSMTRMPSLVGERDDRDRTIAALSADIERHSAPVLRRQVLRALADLPAGTAPASAEELLARLAWQAPRRAATNRAGATAMLAEAGTVGVTGYGGLTSYARALLESSEPGAAQTANAADLLQSALPTPVSEFLVQPDLTVVVPGPPTSELQRELALAADLESSGGASVYRISTASLRRALDAGRTGTELRQFFATTSRTPIPQALDYLITDTSTQHGRLRVGVASSYLRADDENLLTQVLAEPAVTALGLQRIAPTVVISGTAISVVLERLRAAGFAPAAESPDGSVVTLTEAQARLPSPRRGRNSPAAPSGVAEHQLVEVVSRLRSADRLARAINQSANRVSQQIAGVTSASILELLRTAIRESATIAVSYVDDTGRPSQRTLQPISLGGGVVRGHAPEEERLRSYPLQRITSVALLED